MKWVFLAVLVFLCTSVAAQEVERHDCDSTQGWHGHGERSVKDGVLTCRYQQFKPPPLFHAVLLTDLRELRIRFRAPSPVYLAIGLEDLDGARFVAASQFPEGDWRLLRLKPRDFKPAPDSPVKKKTIHPERLGFGYAIAPVPLRPAAQGGLIEIDSIEIERESLPQKRGDLIVTDSMEIRESEHRIGDLRVEPGGQLLVSAPRFVLQGNIAIDRGVLAVRSSVFVIPQRFNHERSVMLSSRASLGLHDASFVTTLPIQVTLRDASSLRMERVRVMGGITCSPEAGCHVHLDKVQHPGEFVLGPGAKFAAKGCRGLLVWTILGPNLLGWISFPEGKRVGEWSAPAIEIDASVRGCRDVMWGVISTAGANGSVRNSRLRAVGVYFGGDSVTELDGEALRKKRIETPDRKLRFTETDIRTWNFYTNDKARLTLSKCTFGEAIAFGDSRIEVRDSTCDGRGGYLRADANTELRMINCEIRCRVVARDAARILLENCRVTGDVHAVGRSRIRLVGTTVVGQIEADPGAQIARE